MVGTFVNVNKGISRYCFIHGADGKDYFCHKNEFVHKSDWEYAWNGNECSFGIKENSDRSKNDVAIDVIPRPVENPNKEKARQDEVRHKQRVQQKAQNIALNNKRKERKDNWDVYCSDHLCYIVEVKEKGSDNPFSMVMPPAVFKSKDSAEENLFYRKAENGEGNLYHLRKCTLHRVGAQYVIKELKPRNKPGKVLYKGRAEIYA